MSQIFCCSADKLKFEAYTIKLENFKLLEITNIELLEIVNIKDQVF